jgi:hypothetical protein
VAEQSGIEIDPQVAAALLDELEEDPALETAAPDAPNGLRLKPIAPASGPEDLR